MKLPFRLATENPVAVMWVLLLITLVTGYQLPRLEIEMSAESMTAEHDPARLVYERTRETFGAGDTLVVAIQDDALWTPARLSTIHDLEKRLAALPFVEGTDSLFNVANTQLVNDEVMANPFLDPIPEDEARLGEVRRQALANPFVRKGLLSEDGRTMAIAVHLKHDDVTKDIEITAAIDQAIAPLRGEVDKVLAFGQPQIGAAVSELIAQDRSSLMPLSLVVLLATLFVTLRRLEGVLLPLVTAVTSVIWTLGGMAMLDIPLTVATSIVPALLVVIGSTEDIHLITAFREARGEGLGVRQSIDRMAEQSGTAVLLTFVTTYLGFLSIGLNDIQLLREFGLVSSTGLLLNFVITLFFIPAALTLLGDRDGRDETEGQLFKRAAERLYASVATQPRHVLFLAALVAVVALWQSARLRLDNDTLSYLPADSPTLADAAFLHRELAGIQSFDIVLDGRINGTFLKAHYLKEAAKLQDFLLQGNSFDRAVSFVDHVRLINRVMDGLPPDRLIIPSDDDVIREYMTFISPKLVSAFVDENFSRMRIHVQHDISSSRRLKGAIAELRGFIAEQLDPALDVQVSGASIMSMDAADSMAEGQAKSLALVVGSILIIISALFTNLRAGLLAVVPNLLPIILFFGVMGAFDIPLNTGTAMVAAIALGICVDDTMHFMVRYHQRMQGNPSVETAIRETMTSEARAITATSIAVAAGFGVLAFSEFRPVVEFGVLSAGAMLVALVATLVLTPILLTFVRLVTLWDILGVQLKSQLVHDCPLFRGLGRYAARKLIVLSRQRHFQAGEYIMRRGDAGDEMFVILEGSVDIHSGGEENRLLGRLGPGDIFGEVALVTETRRIADVIAVTPTHALVLRWGDLQRLGRFMPRSSAILYRNVASLVGKRLAAMSV